MSNLYHYTSLETLALILEHKKIRFSNLCKLDDPLEKYVSIKAYLPGKTTIEDSRINLGSYCFVSCWSKEPEELIAMWDMYADRKRGVRIELPAEMFNPEYDVYMRKKQKSLFEYDAPNIQPELISVEYDRIKDPPLFHENRQQIGNLGRYKTKDWEFQQEIRFRLYLTKTRYGSECYLISQESWQAEIEEPPDKEYIDFELKDEALRQIKIIRGPNMTEAQRIILAALVDKNGINNSQVNDSKFTDIK